MGSPQRQGSGRRRVVPPVQDSFDTMLDEFEFSSFNKKPAAQRSPMKHQPQPIKKKNSIFDDDDEFGWVAPCHEIGLHFEIIVF